MKLVYVFVCHTLYMRPFHSHLYLPACLINSRGQYETLCAKCSSKLFCLSNASWSLSSDTRHLLEMKCMRNVG
ncbi:hypothetical protein H5410_040325 [Solanum commersonii]|uniref:Uncharacterized protein n=1 Tax=Solanum commersonii TaxID=4109 RepID=A0A9J5XNJ6_SOLCO|nr:hypothetical protein H5410_040325 [Solanum commersonii]